MHKFFSCVVAAGLVALLSAATASSGRERSTARLAAFPGASWPTVGGNLANSRYSTLTQINRSNVAKLVRVWTTEINPGFNASGVVESPPTVVGKTLYASSSRGTPAALDAATGKLLWSNEPTTRGGKTGNGRGVSVGDGMLFAGQGDGTLTAFDLASGAVRWKTLINTGNVPTYSPATPIFWNHTVYTSLTGNDLGKLRGAIFAYDAKTGALKWTFYIVPFAGQPGSSTWGDPKELDVGGGGTWTYGAIDPKLGLLYEPTGNPSPDFGRAAGKNLYTDAVIALNLKTGKLKWYFQTVHHDQWDYDCASPPILYDLNVGKRVQHGLTISCKSGYTYNLDRATGKPLTPVKELPPPNAQTIDAATRDYVAAWSKTQPIPTNSNLVPHCATSQMVPGPAPDGKPYEYSCVFAYVGPDHFTVHPVSIGGAVNYEPGSINPTLGYTRSWSCRSGFRFERRLHGIASHRASARRHVHRSQLAERQERLAEALLLGLRDQLQERLCCDCEWAGVRDRYVRRGARLRREERPRALVVYRAGVDGRQLRTRDLLRQREGVHRARREPRRQDRHGPGRQELRHRFLIAVTTLKADARGTSPLASASACGI